jgi:hypothetical protein
LTRSPDIPDAVSRFVLTSIPSVPHLESLLLLWREAGDWNAERLASRLFIGRAQAQSLLEELCRADLLECDGDPMAYRCRREPDSLLALIADVDAIYRRQLKAITSLIHSNVDRKAARFAQAFSWKKD